jgi:hypothetical protein
MKTSISRMFEKKTKGKSHNKKKNPGDQHQL